MLQPQAAQQTIFANVFSFALRVGSRVLRNLANLSVIVAAGLTAQWLFPATFISVAAYFPGHIGRILPGIMADLISGYQTVGERRAIRQSSPAGLVTEMACENAAEVAPMFRNAFFAPVLTPQWLLASAAVPGFISSVVESVEETFFAAPAPNRHVTQ